MPVGARELRRGAAHGRRDLPRAQGRAEEDAASARPSATRAASPRTSAATKRPSRSSWRPSTRPATSPAPGRRIALDPAASSFYDDGEGAVQSSRARAASSPRAEMVDYYAALVDKYPIISIEDGLAEDDWDGWQAHDRDARRPRADRRRRPLRDQHRAPRPGHREGLGQLHPHQAQPDRHAHRDARRHRDGARAPAGRPSARTAPARPRTPRIADLAVATNAGQIKTGAPARTDRVAKYNQLLRIEEMLGEVAYYPGMNAFYNLRKP